MVTWIKANQLLASSSVAWLIAIAPVGKLGKGIAHVVGIATSIESVRYSRQLVKQEARRSAMEAVNQEMEVIDLALQAYSQEQALREMYGVNATYSPEVRNELEKSLEHLVREPSAGRDSSTYTYTYRKNLYLALVSLLEVGKSKTYIVERVLGKVGRDFDGGMAMLNELISEGESNNW